jgi:hypothetical protein
VARFIEHLYTQLVTISIYNSLTGLHTLKITVTAAHTKSSVFTSRFLVTDPDSVLCLGPCRLPNIPQLTPRLAAISLLFSSLPVSHDSHNKQGPFPLNSIGFRNGDAVCLLRGGQRILPQTLTVLTSSRFAVMLQRSTS